MSKKLYEESNLQAIANAIRIKNGENDTYKPSEMAEAIRGIQTNPVLEDLSVNSNGHYTPSSGKDGFSSVTVVVGEGHGLKWEEANTLELHNTFDSDVDTEDFSFGTDYILSHGTEYIDTGYVSKNNSKIVLKINIKNTLGNNLNTQAWLAVCGFDPGILLFAANYNNTPGYWVYNGCGGLQQMFNCDLEITMNRGMIHYAFGSFFEKNLYCPEKASDLTSNTKTFHIFKYNGNNGMKCTARLYECSIYEDDTLVMHLIPAKDSSNVVCLYDTVSEDYIYNSGTGTFEYVEGDSNP